MPSLRELDVEDLLANLESELNEIASVDRKLSSSTKKTFTTASCSSSSSSASMIDSLLDLTNEVDMITGYRGGKEISGSGSRPTSNNVSLGNVGSRTLSPMIMTTDPRLGEEKCKNVYLGDDSGVSSLGSTRCLPCLKVRCTACDFNVLRFVEQGWLESADYLFFRNNFPDQAKLSKCLEFASKGTTSYCCQCSWLTIEKAVQSMPSSLLPSGQATGAEGLLMIRRGTIALSGTPSIERELSRSGTKLKVVGGTISASTSFSSWVCGQI